MPIFKTTKAGAEKFDGHTRPSATIPQEVRSQLREVLEQETITDLDWQVFEIAAQVAEEQGRRVELFFVTSK
jgi:hypothetical protein